MTGGTMRSWLTRDRFIAGILVILFLIAVVVVSRDGTSQGAGGGYIDEYGGSPAVYQRIVTETDCAALQAEFDQAAANNDGAEPGTQQHRQTTGYMSAADDRMRAIGCY